MSQEFIHGFHSVQAVLLARPKAILEVVYAAERADKRLQDLLEQLEAAQVKIIPTQLKKIDQLFPDATHQGIVAKVRLLEPFGEDKIEQICESVERPRFLILDGVTDPHNIGACLRSAEAAGVHGVIVPKDRSGTLTATARKISSGASEVLPLIKVTNLARTLKHLQNLGIYVVGTAGETDTNIYDFEFPRHCGIALVMGAEGTGMRRLTRENCDALVKIPMAGIVSSLNVSVAAGVCLFEIVRQLS